MALALAALAALHPWQTERRPPRVAVAPDIGARVGGAVAIARESPAPQASVAVAAARPALLVRSPSPQRRPGTGPAVAPAVAVALPPAPAPEPAPAPQPAAVEPAPGPPAATQPVAVQPAPAPPAAPATPPSPLPAASGTPPPVTAGLPDPDPEEACEGDEYEVTVQALAPPDEHGEAPVEIVIRRVGDAEGETIRLEGSLADVGELLDLIAVKGDCVSVELLPPLDPETPGPVLP